MVMVRWVLAVLVAGAIAVPAYGYFSLRLAGDSSGGSAFRSAYAADILTVAVTLALTIGALIALIHDRGRFRAFLLAASLLLLAGSTLSLREIQYSWGTGDIRDAWPIPALSRSPPTGASEGICITSSMFAVAISNPDSGDSFSIFRGVWPWSFDQQQLDDLLPACVDP
jgi:hypothetical protein